jgi:hypothetical protein
MSWKDIIKNKSDEEWTPTKEERLQGVGGDELAEIVFNDLRPIVVEFMGEIDPQRDQRNNPSRKIRDNIKALIEVYNRLEKIGDKRYG